MSVLDYGMCTLVTPMYCTVLYNVIFFPLDMVSGSPVYGIFLISISPFRK